MRFEKAVLISCAFARAIAPEECRIALRGDKWAKFSCALHGRAEQAPPLRRKKQKNEMQIPHP